MWVGGVGGVGESGGLVGVGEVSGVGRKKLRLRETMLNQMEKVTTLPATGFNGL